MIFLNGNLAAKSLGFLLALGVGVGEGIHVDDVLVVLLVVGVGLRSFNFLEVLSLDNFPHRVLLDALLVFFLLGIFGQHLLDSLTLLAFELVLLLDAVLK